MKPYDIGIRIAQRFLYGYMHHSQMASFFDLLKMKITADNQRKNAFEDAKKREKMDKYIACELEQLPLYTVENVHTIVKELGNASYDTIKGNKKELLKKAVMGLANYERDTIKIFESLLNEAKQIKDEKLIKCIEKDIQEVKEELESIEHFYKELEKHEFDYDKFKKEKGDTDMPRYDRYDDDRYEDRRRRRMEMDDDFMLPLWMDEEYDRRRRYMDDDRYEPMGFADRHYREYEREYPHEMEDARRRRYRRRYR